MLTGGTGAGNGVSKIQSTGERKRTYQIVVGPLADIGGLHAQVLEGLGRRVNDLIVELAFDLVARKAGVPPEDAVDELSQGLQDRLGQVDVPALLVDFAIDQLGDLGHRVLAGAVQFEGLAGRAVVVEHALEGLADFVDLHLIRIWQSIS